MIQQVLCVCVLVLTAKGWKNPAFVLQSIPSASQRQERLLPGTPWIVGEDLPDGIVEFLRIERLFVGWNGFAGGSPPYQPFFLAVHNVHG